VTEEDGQHNRSPSSPPKQFRIIDVTESIARECRDQRGSGTDCNEGAGTRRGLLPEWAHTQASVTSSLQPDLGVRGETIEQPVYNSRSLIVPSPHSSFSMVSPVNDPELESCRVPTPSSQQADAASNLLYLSQNCLPPTTFIEDRDVHTPLLIPELSSPTDSHTPFHLDDALVSGTSYQQLQSRLRHHLFQESRSCAPTRACTPERAVLDGLPEEHQPFPISPDKIHDDERFILSEEQECRLWRNWIEEVSPWVRLPFASS
jgi:hypothetical protein